MAKMFGDDVVVTFQKEIEAVDEKDRREDRIENSAEV